MSYQRKPLGSPCAACGTPVEAEGLAVRTLTRTLPYTPKIWHRACFEAQKAPTAVAQAPAATAATAARAA